MGGMGQMIQGVGQAWLGTQQGIDDSKSAIRQAGFEQAADTYNANLALDRGRMAAGRARMEGSVMLARQKSAYAASGVDPGVGTAAQVQENTAAQNALDAQTIENNAAREAWGYRLQAGQSKENLDTRLSSNRRQQYGSILSGIGSFASGATSAGSFFGGGGGGGGGGGSYSQGYGDGAFDGAGG